MLLSLVYTREWIIIIAVKSILSIDSTTRNSPKKKFRDVHKAVHAMNRNVHYVICSYKM